MTKDRLMGMISYEQSAYEVRIDLAAAHARAWERLSRPGTWLNADQRISVACEARAAKRCAFCVERKKALSPFAVNGRHDATTTLPEEWIDIIHRIVSDPGRLTQGWYGRTVGQYISDGEYVELVSVVAHATAIDTFARGLGCDLWPLPDAQPGAPSRYRPAEARCNGAWVPTIAWEEHGPNEADFFQGFPANIKMALTLVPDEARSFFDIVAHQYLLGPAMRDFENEYRAISHAQIELLAGRVSAINQCTY
jgi:hypothetical protein